MFYPKLAITNIKKNAKIYIPYILACIGTIAMFYIMMFLTENQAAGESVLYLILSLGTIVIGLFSFCIIVYTNSFLIKRRKKEIGLYNILGMGKRHIAKVMSLETLFIAIGTIAAGIGIGILLSKLMLLLLMNMLQFDIQFGFEISANAITTTIILFAAIFGVTLISNIRQVTVSQPIELLHGGNVGEKEPKTKWLLTIIGVVSLGIGYYIAITTEQPLRAVMMFFVAVVLVIIGTYCLFTAGSIAILKLMKKKKSYYYKTKHFTSVSGMLYRMKQNAVGLANICILSTMVLVMVSSTSSLFIGFEDSMNMQHPREIEFLADNLEQSDYMILQDLILDIADKQEVSLQDISSYMYTEYLVYNDRGTIIGEKDSDFYYDDEGIAAIYVLTLDEYNRLMGKNETLEGSEVLLYETDTPWGYDYIKAGDKEYKIKSIVEELAIQTTFLDAFTDVYYVVVNDTDTAWEIENALLDVEDSKKNVIMSYYMGFNVELEDEEQIEFTRFLDDEILEGVSGLKSEGGRWSVACRAADESEFFVMNGGLFFLGIFLGTLFMMATILIMYYKQISEGYDDKQRFMIMQKVGMSKAEIKKTIRSQILMVFFLPLLCACIHVAAAFTMIARLLNVFSLRNTTLFMMCTLATIAIFAVLYAIAYCMTSRAYYKIVGESTN